MDFCLELILLQGEKHNGGAWEKKKRRKFNAARKQKLLFQLHQVGSVFWLTQGDCSDWRWSEFRRARCSAGYM